MTRPTEEAGLERIFKVLAEERFDGTGEAFALLPNEMMRIERGRHLRAAPYLRSGQRQGYANGFKPKRVKTRIGKLDLAVPQMRASDFYPSFLEKGLKLERAFRLALALRPGGRPARSA